MAIFQDVIKYAADKGFTDIHVTGGHPVVYRSHGDIIFDKKNVFSHADVDRLVSKMLNNKQRAMLRRQWSVDFALTSVGVMRGMIRDNRFSQLENTVELNRNAGMFTDRTYMEAYLNEVPSFVPPNEIFRPSKGHEEIIHDPPIFDAEEIPTLAAPARRAAKPAPAQPAGAASVLPEEDDEIFGPILNISDHDDLGVIVEDMKKKKVDYGQNRVQEAGNPASTAPDAP